jgi:proline iminopeptidase
MKLFAATVSALALFASLSLGTATGAAEAPAPAESRRETVLDRIVHIEEQIQEIPQVPPLCDELELEKRRINVGDCELYCETEGRGVPIVLISGGPGNSHHSFHPCFGRAASFSQVIYYDQRGCGRSDYKPGSGYSIDQAVGDLNKLREALKIDRWVLLGWSYGGALAQLYTLEHPEHAAGLVLVGATDAGSHLQLQPTRQYVYLSPEERERIAAIYREKSLPEDKLVYNIHLNGDWKRQSFYKPTREELARMARYEWKHDPVFRRSICATLGKLDFRGLFEDCPVPSLILEGKYDLTWGADKAEKLHACHPGAKLVMFDRSGHGPFMDEPEEFFSVLREFVQGLPEVDAAGIAAWKKSVADRPRKLAAEAAAASDSVTFRTKEPAPTEFDRWTFFWRSPAVAQGATCGYEVRTDQGAEWFRYALRPSGPGSSVRSDFSKDQGDLSRLQGKDIVVRFWTSRGKIEFSAAMQLTFEFYTDGRAIKTVEGIRQGQ